MTSTQPNTKVRAACEACHQRKIRCQPQPGSFKRQACNANDRQCYYLARAKAGRPRLSSRRTTCESLAQSSTGSPTPEEPTIWSDLPSQPTLSSLDLPTTLDWDDLCNLDSVGMFDERVGSFSDAFQADPTGKTMAAMNCTSASLAWLSHLPSPTLIAPTDSERSPTGSADDSSQRLFMTLLKTCEDLHNIQQNLAVMLSNAKQYALDVPAHLQPTLRSLDAAGEALIGAVQHPSSPGGSNHVRLEALPALALTTSIKLLAICDILIQSAATGIRSLSQVQLLSRVEFNLTQVTTSLQQLGGAGGSLTTIGGESLEKAKALKRKNRALLERLPPELGGYH